MNASLLAGIHLNGGRPVYGSTDDLLDNQFAKAADMRPLYESLTTFLKKHFPNSAVLRKSQHSAIGGDAIRYWPAGRISVDIAARRA
jgi:hypothetical protein